ncbi:MAG: EAL domain-containing protein [Paracoccaceae bacterium]
MPRSSNAQASSPLDYATGMAEGGARDMVAASLAAGDCVLACQPVLRADTRAPAFHEGLIRVRDRTGRVIPARHFMPGIEEASLGRDIDAAALRLAFETLGRKPHMRLSVNVSARSFGDGAWRDALARGLSDRPDAGPRLILEIAERSAMQLPEVVVRFMAETRPAGLTFALDEFGSGEVSLRALRDFGFDIAKIAQPYARDLDVDPDNQVMAQALIDVAHQFGLYAIGQGIETAAEADTMTRMGADCLQGFHLGMPRIDGEG